MSFFVASDFLSSAFDATGLPSGPTPKNFEMYAGAVFLVSRNV